MCRMTVSDGAPWERLGAVPTLAMGMAAFKYHRIDSRKNNIAMMFFRCEIQATDSTFTGCTAKSRAAKKAPGIVNLRKMIQINNDSATCNIRLVTWYPVGCLSHNRHSIQSVVLVAGQKSIASVVHQYRYGPSVACIRGLSVRSTSSSRTNRPPRQGMYAKNAATAIIAAPTGTPSGNADDIAVSGRARGHIYVKRSCA